LTSESSLEVSGIDTEPIAATPTLAEFGFFFSA
jgi:hypothetical protein